MGRESRWCQCAGPDLAGERRRPEIARARVREGEGRQAERGEGRVKAGWQGEQEVIESKRSCSNQLN